jgi:hypothetical protein
MKIRTWFRLFGGNRRPQIELLTFRPRVNREIRARLIKAHSNASRPSGSLLASAMSIMIIVILISAAQSTAVGAAETTASNSTAATGTSHLYELEFLQESNCPYGSWLIPWAVVLDNETLVQPSNAAVPTPSSYPDSRLTSNSSYSAIWFSVPDGTYSYTILPDNFFGTVGTGTVAIDGSSVEIQIYAFVTAEGCSTTSTTATTAPATFTLTVTTTQTATSTQTVSITSTVPATTSTLTVTTPFPQTTLTTVETITGPSTTVLGPTTTVTSTQTVTSNTKPIPSSVPTWVYAIMIALLVIGLAVGYTIKRPSTSIPLV